MLLRILNSAEEAIISILLLVTTILVFIDVVMRFGFSAGFMWSQELTLHMSGWFVLFGASYGIKVGSHIGMDAFVKLFPEIGRRLLTGVASILALIYCGLVIYGSVLYTKKVHMIGLELEDMPLQEWLANGVPLIVGFTLIIIRLLMVLKGVITGEIDGFKHADEAKESMEIVKDLKGEELI
jgi:C4-dicarboxylate transporter, DctQ subunit